MDKKIIVLMSTYNGEQYLEEQLQSILKQKFLNNNYVVEILVRDDGSKDRTPKILEKYQRRGLLDFYTGENLGLEKSFWNLIKCVKDADYYAFSDQDDVWFRDKISRAVERLLQEKDGGDVPLLYSSAVIPTDKHLHPLENAVDRRKKFTDFSHALIYSTAPGCTFVFNRQARQYLIMYDMERNYVEMHDWLTHKIITLFGKMIYDENPSMFYRQHDNNVIGFRKSGIKDFYNRIYRFFFDWKCERSRIAEDIEAIYGDKINKNNKNGICLYLVAHYMDSVSNSVHFLSERAFRTGTIHDLIMFFLIICRKM